MKKQTNEEIKKELIKQLKAKGLTKWEKTGTSTRYTFKEMGRLKVFLYLSNKIRIFIETSGEGSYFIKMQENSYSFKDLGNTIQAWELERLFKQKVIACEFMNSTSDHATCDECNRLHKLSYLRPYKS